MVTNRKDIINQIVEEIQTPDYLKTQISSSYMLSISKKMQMIIESFSRFDIQFTLSLIYVYLKEYNLFKYFDLAKELVKEVHQNKLFTLNEFKVFLYNPENYVKTQCNSWNDLIEDYYIYLSYEDLSYADIQRKKINEIFNFLSQEEITANRPLLKEINDTFIYEADKRNYRENKIIRSAKIARKTIFTNTPISIDDIIQKDTRNIINNKLHMLRMYKGATYLVNLESFRLPYITEILKEFPDVKFQVDTLNENQIILKYHDETQIDLELEYEKYNIAKSIGDYESTEKILLNIINHTANPGAQLYGSLAYTYMKMKNIEEALKYYKIANFLSFKNYDETTYDNIICYLKACTEKPLDYFKVNLNAARLCEEYDISEDTIRNIQYLVYDKSYEINDALNCCTETEIQKIVLKLYFIEKLLLRNSSIKAYELLEELKREIKTYPNLIISYEELNENKHLLKLESKNRQAKKMPRKKY